MSEVKEIQLDQVGHLREVSQRISDFLQKRLTAYLSTLTPLCAPRRVLGEFMESAFREKVPGADRNFAEIEERFKSLTRDVFGQPAKLGTPVPNIKNELEASPWQYLYAVGGDDAHRVTVTSPVSWVLSYKGPYNLEDLIAQRLAGETIDSQAVKGLLLRSLTLWKLMELTPDLPKLFEDLRFPVTVETSAVSGDLPHVVIRSVIPAFRPQDEIVQTVTRLSGVPVFEELIDVDALAALPDPFRDQVLGFVS
jgi:hypothetical protein